MSWLDYLRKSWSSNREKLRDKMVSHDPTAGIQAHQPFYGSEILVNNLPPFHLRTGRLMMRSDPIVNFALNVRNAALMVAEVEITAKNEAVRKWVQKQWDTLWDKHRNKILATKAWGFQPLQLVFKYGSTGLPDIDDVKDFAPEDCRAQELGGKVCGFKIKDRKVFQPQALWMTFNAEYGSPYGTGCLRRQYPPWYEKWTNHGSKKLGQLRMIKDAYIGDIWWYPKDQIVEIPLSDGTTARMAWRDLVRELGENRLSGNAVYVPTVYDDKGNKLLDYTPPQAIPGASQVFDWEDRHNSDILRGADVPLEVIEASETGSGYSGRSIPFMVVLSVCTGELTEYVQAIDVVLRQVAWLIWGGDPEFEIKPKSLVESFAADASGSPMGGGAIGGQPGQRPPPQQQPPQQMPQRQNLNGNGRQFHEQFDEGPEPLDSISLIGSASARSRIRGAAFRIRALKKNDLTPLETLSELIELEIQALRRGLSSDLSASMLGGQLTGMADAWATVPAEAIPPLTLPQGSPGPPPPPDVPPSIASLLGPDEPTPNVTFPVVEDALEVLADAPALARPDFRATAAAVKEGAFAITGDLTDSTVADVRDLLAENLAKGADREAFVDAVVTRLGEGGPLSESHVENIFRTNVAAAMSDGQDRALKAPLVVDAFPYRAYYATSDTRVRKEHRALEKLGLDGTNIYRADDPSFIKFRPPWDFQCRCSWTPVTVEQAARRGVREAQEWLERVKAMAAELGGSEYQYFERTAPAAPQWVTPPGFETSPEFERR